jgi:hypothetical protein
VSKLTVTCDEFQPVLRNTLVGFAAIRIAELRLAILDVAVHQKGDSRWAQLPAKPQVYCDGELVELVRDDAGRPQYIAMMKFDTPEIREAFSCAVVKAVMEHTPGAFETPQEEESVSYFIRPAQ